MLRRRCMQSSPESHPLEAEAVLLSLFRGRLRRSLLSDTFYQKPGASGAKRAQIMQRPSVGVGAVVHATQVLSHVTQGLSHVTQGLSHVTQGLYICHPRSPWNSLTPQVHAPPLFVKLPRMHIHACPHSRMRPRVAHARQRMSTRLCVSTHCRDLPAGCGWRGAYGLLGLCVHLEGKPQAHACLTENTHATNIGYVRMYGVPGTPGIRTYPTTMHFS